jgi:3-dehydroquinate synthase
MLTMEQLRVELPSHSYPIWFGQNLFEQSGELLSPICRSKKIALVTNPTVWELFGPRVMAALRSAGFDVVLVLMPDGEQYKTLDTLANLYEQLLAGGLDRHSTIIALGGGVVGDTAGFAAATYMRGISFIQAPTTLLAQVDSSVGGKVAVDAGQAKNLVGAFYQPKAVIIDTDTLSMLPYHHLRSGLAEVVKHGVLGSPHLFEHIEQSGAEPIEWIVREAIQVKIDIVQQDPEERGIRAILNLGHTTGHAIEAVTGFQVSHGDGVAIGILAATYIAMDMGICAGDVLPRLLAVYKRLGLPSTVQADPAIIYQAMFSDKKKSDGHLRFILPKAIGQVVTRDDVPETTIMDALGSIATGGKRTAEDAS